MHKMKTSKRTSQRRHRAEVLSVLNYVRFGSSEQVQTSENLNVNVSSLDDRLDLLGTCVHQVKSCSIESSEPQFDMECSIQNKILHDSDIPSENIRLWALKHNVTHCALRDLLSLLRTYKDFENLPKDPRTLLNTPTNSKQSVYPVSGGSCIYFDFSETIKKKIRRNYKES